jgi:predicted ABC-type ATPase
MPVIYIIAGANGAGKTTAAYNLLPEVFETSEFVNADEIAHGLSPFNFEGVTLQAGRIMMERINQLVKEKKSFAFETTLSGVTYLELIKLAKLAGYHIIFLFIWLENFRLAKSRVAERVRKGGHKIPDEVIEIRYKKGIENFPEYASQADDWYVFDNSGTEYLLIAKSVEKEEEIINFEIFSKISGK